ncbi:MAG: exodeoxyribonuclease VII large subunit [Woeseiaceae bacterium]|nr:exodeoxyribonuclease VII large subunit [Woeseiaceae bacterium]
MDDRFAKGGTVGALTVSELNRQARQLLERGFATVQVEGELSNLARPASGHLYFTLKDSSAQIRCAYFRQRQRGPTIRLADGDQVLATGRVSIYEARGDYQLIVEQLEPAGEGELRRRFEALKKKLAAEGLFDEAIKQPLPALPRCIGVITSPAGAAIRDILSILKRRFPAIPVIIYPSAVQGAAAVPELLAALDSAVRRDECDVLIIGRGGGSLEDLWAFNDEGLARALHACPIPVVSAVGHEVDFTIADFVADLRAPTPSGAAEQVVPDQAAWQRSLQALAERLNAHIGRRLEARQQQLDWLAKRLAQGSRRQRSPASPNGLPTSVCASPPACATASRLAGNTANDCRRGCGARHRPPASSARVTAAPHWPHSSGARPAGALRCSSTGSRWLYAHCTRSARSPRSNAAMRSSAPAKVVACCATQQWSNPVTMCALAFRAARYSRP